MKVNQPGVKSVSKILKNIFVRSGAFAIATLVLVGLAGDTLPYSRTRDRITDALASPGARIAGLIYPQGVHTGTGARFWGSRSEERRVGKECMVRRSTRDYRRQ